MWTVFVWFTLAPQWGVVQVATFCRGPSKAGNFDTIWRLSSWLWILICWTCKALWPDSDAGYVSTMYDVTDIAADCLYLFPASDLPSGIA